MINQQTYTKLKNKTNGHKSANGADNRSRQLAALLEVSRHVVSLDTEPLLGLILDQLKQVVDYQSGAIVALDEDQLTVTAVRGVTLDQSALAWQISIDHFEVRRRVIERQTPIIIADIWADNDKATIFRNTVGPQLKKTFGHSRSWMGIPLIVKNQFVGLLSLFHETTAYFGPEDAERALVFAHQVAVALENDRLYQQVSHLATLQERDRLAREMHDELAQAIGFINIKASIIEAAIDQENLGEAKMHLRELKEIAKETYTDIREDIFSLRTKVKTGDCFLERLRDYLEEYQSYHQVNVDLVIANDSLADFSADVGNQLLRIIQEALSNVRKHAQANRAAICFQKAGDQVRITVQDNGQGFDPIQLSGGNGVSFGLQIMRERAACVGGQVEIDTAPGQGTTLQIQLPYQA